MKIKGSETDNIRFKDLKCGDIFTMRNGDGYAMKVKTLEIGPQHFRAAHLDKGQVFAVEDEAWCRLFPNATLVPDGVRE